MAITIKLTFLAGRYHATLWGRHVNEGVPEWPPSPWRFLRALIAVWKRTCPRISEEQINAVLTALIQPPCFMLPPHRIAHTRHYMPWEKKGPADRALVFDTFVAVRRENSVFLGWPEADLSSDQIAALGTLLRNLTSLGRAESWVDAELSEDQLSWNCRPASDSDEIPTQVFCPDPNSAFRSEHFPVLDEKKLSNGKINPSEFLFDCPRWHLCLDTETVHAKKWPTIPGAMWVNYSRPVEADSTVRKRALHQHKRFTIAQFLLDGPVLPLVTDTVFIAEAVRNAAMSKFREWCKRHPECADEYQRTDSTGSYASPVLSGKDSAGNILCSRLHALYLPTPDVGDQKRIRHITVYSREGFAEGEISALRGLHKVRVSGENELRAQLIGLGKSDDFTNQLFREVREMYPVTPYLGPAHIGERGRERFMRKAIRREWRRLSEQVPDFRGVELVDVAVLSPDENSWTGRPRPFEYRRSRKKHFGEKYRPAGLYKLTFSRPIRGPVCLGYASHFGFGLFAAME